MTTLRRELIKTIFDLLELAYQDNPPTAHASSHNKYQAEKIADKILELRAFKPKIDTARWGMDWLGAGVEVTQEQIDNERFIEKALETFESDMNCPKNWNWYPSRSSEERAWRGFREFVVEQYRKDQKCFQSYQTWRNSQFARGAMANSRIATNPELFQASWTDFLNSNPQKQKPNEPIVDANDIPVSY